MITKKLPKPDMKRQKQGQTRLYNISDGEDLTKSEWQLGD